MKHIRNLREALPLMKCLSSDIRVSILELLQRKGPMRMTDIASELGISNGSLSPHMKALSENGFIEINQSAGKHGVLRICSVVEQQLLIDLEGGASDANVYETEIGVGQYVGYEIYPTCGISTPQHMIGVEDDPGYFSSPERISAGILWMGHGYVEYILPNYLKPGQRVTELLVSMEIASEAPGYREDWPSDITFSINGTELCCWTLPSDFGTNRGIYTPSWWDRNWNQYGQLKFLSVDENGSYIDGVKRGAATLGTLGLAAGMPIVLRLSAPDTAQHNGGLTIYGRGFGNFDQDIRVRMHYADEE